MSEEMRPSNNAVPKWSMAAGGLGPLVIGVSGLVLAVTTVEFRKVVPGALIILGLVTVAAVFAKRHIATWIAMGVATALVLTGAAAYANPKILRLDAPAPNPSATATTLPPPPPSPTPSVPPVVEITNPREVDRGAVPGCLYVRFKAELPSGKAFAVANAMEDDPRLFYEGKVIESNGEWTAEVVLGDEQTGRGRSYRLVVIMLDEQWSEYLAATRPEPDADWWSGLTHPPGGVELATLEVRRENKAEIACA